MMQTIPEFLYCPIPKYQEGQLILDSQEGGHVLFEEEDKRLEAYRNSEDFSLVKIKTETLDTYEYFESEKCWRTPRLTKANFE